MTWTLTDVDAQVGRLHVVTPFDTGLPVFPRTAPPPHTMEIPLRVR